MAITNGYTDLEEYKDRFDVGDHDDDSDIESVITAVSRSIDNICWQRFYTTSADETRYYTADFGGWHDGRISFRHSDRDHYFPDRFINRVFYHSAFALGGFRQT